MAQVIAGIKEVFLIDNATALTDISTVDLGLGFRQNGQFIGEPFNPIEDNRTRQFPNLYNFRAEFGTMQVANATIIQLIAYTKAGGAGAAIITSGVSIQTTTVAPVTGRGNIFNFDLGDSLALDWELLLTPTERMINITLERAFGQAAAQALVDASAATNVLTFTPPTDLLPALDAALVSSGFLHPGALGPTGGVFDIPAIQLGDFRISFATKGNKNAFNMSLVNSIHMELEGTMSSADSAALSAVMAHDLPAADFEVVLDGTNKITVKGLSFSQTGSFEVGDENRNAKVKLQGDLDLDFVDVTDPTDIVFHTFLGGV